MSDTYGVSVIAFGAIGDGKADDAPALQAALDAGSPRVVIPSGHYVLGKGLRVRSDTHILAHPGARIEFSHGVGQTPDDFLLTNADFEQGNQNIRIEGGIWDGNNPGNPRGPDAPDSYSGVMINFTNVTGLTLRDMLLVDAESYFVRFGGVRNFLVEDISFEIRTLRPNQDGIHISGHCSDGVVRCIRGLGTRTPNDDMVALLADDALHRAQNLNGAFNGPIQNIRVENLRASSCHSFVRLLSVDHPIEGIQISDVAGGCVCSAVNMDACRDCRVKLFREDDRPGGVGSITNVVLTDFNVYKASDQSRQPLIDFRTRADAFRIERFLRDNAKDCSPETPTLVIEKAGPLDVVVEGFDPAACTAGKMGGMAMPGGPSASRSSKSLDVDGKHVLTHGGFSSLAVNGPVGDLNCD